MTTIPNAYSKNGYLFRLVKRAGPWAIYSQTRTGTESPVRWELCRVRSREARQTSKFRIAAGEYLPGTQEWGRHAWTFWTQGQAQVRLSSLLTKSGNPHHKTIWEVSDALSSLE